MKFAEVLLPVPIPKSFCYAIPPQLDLELVVGHRVLVEFGNRKMYTGIVSEIHQKVPEKYDPKPILEVLEVEPSVLPSQIKLWQWVADYYMCSIGEVLNVALPSGLKLSSQSFLQIHPHFIVEENLERLNDREFTLMSYLEKEQTIPYTQVGEILEIKSPYKTIKNLIEMEAILLIEKIKEKYKPKMEKRLRLVQYYAEQPHLVDKLFEHLAKKTKQEDALLKYLSLVPIHDDHLLNYHGVNKREFLHVGRPLSPSSVGTMTKNGIFEEFERQVPRFELSAADKVQPTPVLSPAQQECLEKTIHGLNEKNVCLLHGVTGSGKTEIYLQLIKSVIDNGEQALFLIPEIALTSQLVRRLKVYFGDVLGIYHSKFSDNERVETWKGVQEDQFQVIVGTRSSIFLPFTDLSLIIVDEEHDSSYKAHDPAPRYQGRDLALVLAHMHHAKVVLGSATPSLESYYLAAKKKYAYAGLHERFGDAQLPEIKIIDIKEKRKQKKMMDDFSDDLLHELNNNTEQGYQSILFQNRRGYSPYVTCDVCNWVPSCPSCNVKLTYHIYRNELRCHYCGHKEHVPHTCVSCGSTNMKTVGLGTQKIEEGLKTHLTDIRVGRLDLDTTRRKHSYEQILTDFEEGHIDVLVGTQMVTKGLDFGNVRLVGIIDADSMLYYPDFRAHERAFQLLTQVSGRAGRRGETGTVILQTHQPKETLFAKVARNDYRNFFRKEIKDREQYHYPPYTRLIKLTVRSEKQDLTNQASEKLARLLVNWLGQKRILGPQEPGINKIRNYFLSEILIKLEREGIDLKKAKGLIQKAILQQKEEKAFSRVWVSIDVDPQ
ncbi:primosomal protein N' [Flammeovirga yaeyamensis]|uniref:Replication restart protein PriA n=1 Tax=Flammeovirga yaeyamensis TaxID=367791 RepID=A0AAX1N2C9_9BACT|nr:primosomal protein N' [Flammeovirga yaeyamensis]MBB3698161.1 primosomal protein N' (replication factor Y) [Flammeovirga yaeyamensis]NMF34482.1 primosomal protein N' [Flammeovirga yaeyamensis]QWG01461.1 primosomal protein N' [Flammeovirga yaeyamensis]